MEVIEGGFVDVDLILFGERPGRQRLLEEIGDAHRDIATGEPRQVLSGVGLGIEIHQQGAKALAGTDCRQIAGNARFANTTFLIEHHAPHVKTSVYQRMTECSGPRYGYATSPVQGLHSQLPSLA
ncbi:hypothetical protein D3C72_1459270 [compost metagenome]